MTLPRLPALAAATFILGGRAQAQGLLAPAGEGAPGTLVTEGQDWGVTSDTVVTLFGHDLQLFEGVEGPMDFNTGGRVCATAPCGWLGGVSLPSGAQIRSLELSACDSDATQQVRVGLFMESRFPNDVESLVPLIGTGAAGTPGCVVVTTNVAPPPTVDNGAAVYFVEVTANPGTNLEWNQVRVRYRLQVSAAPATATFPNDVPTTHPFFRFVEAMAASGLTGGCAPNAFCPDQPVTRGQMAVFLSTALGLHFPN